MSLRFRVLLLALSALLVVSCSPPSAEDLVTDILQVRNEFEVRLTSWIVRDEGTANARLYLDVTVLKNTAEPLDYLTVMVEQQDAAGNTLSEKRVSFEVVQLERGLSQTTGVEVFPAQPGVEGVRLYIEPNPPRDTWGEFRELARVRPRS